MLSRRALADLLAGVLVLGMLAEWTLVTGGLPVAARLGLAVPAAPTASQPRARPAFQTGMLFPQWGRAAYSPSNPAYTTGLREISQQTGARWVELIINFYQQTYLSPTLEDNGGTVTPASLRAGILAAHAQGDRVFIVPFISLVQPTPWQTHWSGDIRCLDAPACDAWFANYWQALKPYLQVAQQAHAEQFALGTELASLEGVGDGYWNTLIEAAHRVFLGQLTYDTNFTTLGHAPGALPEWFRNPALATIGVSVYFSLTSGPAPVALSQVSSLWATHARAPLDAFSVWLGRPLLISEIGYRESADALYYPFAATSAAPADPAMQAAAYNAALANVIPDRHIAGIYFYAWSVPLFEPNNLPAAHVLWQWYMSPAA